MPGVIRDGGLVPRRSLLVAASGFAIAFVILVAAMLLTPAGQRLDAGSLAAFPALRSTVLLEAYAARHLLLGVQVAIVAGMSVWAAIDRRWRAVASAAVILVASALLSRLLKDVLLPRPQLGDFGYPYNTLPSGHAAIAFAGVVAVVWLSPRRLTPALVAATGTIAVAVGAMSVLSFAHRVADVLSAVLFVSALACAVRAASRAAPVGRGVQRTTWLWSGVLVGGAGCVAMIATAIQRGAPAETFAVAVGVATLGSSMVAVALQTPILPSSRRRRLRRSGTAPSAR